MMKDAGEAIANGQAKAESFLTPGRRAFQPLELAEHAHLLFVRDAGAGIPYLDADLFAVTTRAPEDATGARIAQRIGQEVGDDATKQLCSGAYRERRRHDMQ